jgi:methionine-rich copper-binding protein CopC
LKEFVYVILIIILYGCAQTTPLTGGPKDKYAPGIDSAKTSPYNGQVNFADDQIRMKFNEYIRLNKASENIIIIPQLKGTPTIEAKNKKLTITFNEKLQENTTYNITFNSAIQDITEKNDSVFQFVFSTGSFIDSLQVTGSIKNAFTNNAIDKMLIGLYPKDLEANFDSIPFKFKPTYLAQSDKNGKFELNYLKKGVYYLFAIKDLNKNLLYDLGESFAFVETKEFNLTAGEIPSFNMNAFQEGSDELFLEDLNFTYPGKIEVLLSQETDSFDVSANLPLIQEETGRRDSLIFWLNQPPVPKMRFYVNLAEKLDTLKPIFSNRPDKAEDVKINQTNNVVKGKLLPAENLRLEFSEPIKSVSKNEVHFFDIDSNEVAIDSFKIDVRGVEFPTFNTLAHRIVIDSAAVSSVFGRENDNAITLTFENEEEDYYGDLIVTMDTLFTESVIVHLLDSKGLIVDFMPHSNKMIFEKLLPGNYQLRLIFDVNKNGEWTTGSFSDGIQPERVIYNSETIKIKSKWEKEIDWRISNE